MTKRVLTFSAIQIVALLLSIFILAFAIAGSHGRLSFSNAGGMVALIVTTILSTPLVYIFAQKHKLPSKKLLFFIATLLFVMSMTAIYVGLPYMTKQFIVDKDKVNQVSLYKDNDLTIELELQSEMFDRVSIEANITKGSDIEFTEFALTIYNDKHKIVNPVFRPLAWDSLHSGTIEMNSFFETNNFSKMNKFALSGQYSIEHTDSLKIKADYTFTKKGRTISNNRQFGVRIANHLKFEKLIKY